MEGTVRTCESEVRAAGTAGENKLSALETKREAKNRPTYQRVEDMLEQSS